MAIKFDVCGEVEDFIYIDDNEGMIDMFNEMDIDGYEFYEATPITVNRNVTIDIEKGE